MGDRLTSIHLCGYGGIADWGTLTAEEMIRQYRKHAQETLEKARAILAAPDDAFHVRVIEGAHKEKLIRVLQEGAGRRRRKRP
jgi:hypothetical protein